MTDSAKIISQFAFFKATNDYWSLNADQRSVVIFKWLESVKSSTQKVWFYQVFPTRYETDILVWGCSELQEVASPSEFFKSFAMSVNPWRKMFDSTYVLWGITKPSIYTKGSSPQEIRPFEEERTTYLVIYPFSKTSDWYLMSKEVRQGMMNEHIKVGKQFTSITQLLLYSFGLQDQEFIVVYETEDLSLFSDLVQTLRNTYGRKYTLSDTPIITAVNRSMDEIISILAH